MDAGFVRNLIPLAERVHVENGDTAAIQLKAVPWPEFDPALLG
jgi:hypothetical protein